VGSSPTAGTKFLRPKLAPFARRIVGVLANQIAAIVPQPAHFSALPVARHEAAYITPHHPAGLSADIIFAGHRNLGFFQAK
jgi:hypothetical protein